MLIVVHVGRSLMPSELTRREVEALFTSIDAENTAEAAARMGITVQRVKNLRHHAYRKLDVGGPNALLKALRSLGFVR